MILAQQWIGILTNTNAIPHFIRTPTLPFELRYSNGSNACYKPHSHPEFSIGVVDSGVSEYVNKNKKQEVRQGSTVIINPEDIHSCNPKEGTHWSYKMLYVDPQWILNLQHQLSDKTVTTFQPFMVTHSQCPLLYNHFQYLAHALIENRPPLFIEQTALHFFSELIFNHSASLDLKEIPTQKLDIAYQYIHDNFTDNLSISEIAAACELSDFYLIHSFKKHYGITPYAYQMVMRINQSKTLLKKGNNLSTIAMELGFSDQSHFHKHFKNIVAATPRQYKNSAKL